MEAIPPVHPPICIILWLFSLTVKLQSCPGSKTTQLAQLMQNDGCLVALDSNRARLASFQLNLERCGVENVLVYHKDARFVSDLGLKFDKVLLDAPCSGNFYAISGKACDFHCQGPPFNWYDR